jgi:hypothetical protein
MTGSLILGDAYFSEGDTRGLLDVGAYAQGLFSRLRRADRSDWVRKFARTLIASGGPSTTPSPGLYVYVCIYANTSGGRKQEGGIQNEEPEAGARHRLE